jgi:KUP system potassium uptake protein
MAALLVGAIGVVYGDIGTSPLYALRESLHLGHVEPTPANILGIVSLIFWSLMIIISVKYLLVVMRADNHGEGGILALMALLGADRVPRGAARRPLLVVLALFGSALMFGDGMITPAISVLSALEGLSVATTTLEPYVVPLTVAVIVALFAVQYRGTASVGAIFGPVMLVWFAVIGLLGLYGIVRQPAVLGAVNPLHAVQFFTTNGMAAFLALGSVFLVVTGGEALYADMGHFGRSPIRRAWFLFVLPALLLNYFGQGALLMTDPSAVHNPFYLLAPEWALLPLVLLATLATSIASQAVISGSFSLARQAVRLGYLPRLTIKHTSDRAIGQIYVPSINALLMIASVSLVLYFRSSTNLAAAYGVAVTATMLITTILIYYTMVRRWHWSRGIALAICIGFGVIDIAFLGANLTKVLHGGWVPLAIGIIGYGLMSTWIRGRELVRIRLRERAEPTEVVMQELRDHPPNSIPGTAVYLTSNPHGFPPHFQHGLDHFKVLHERVILLTVTIKEIPRVEPEARVDVHQRAEGLWRVHAHYGFMEDPKIGEVLTACAEKGLAIDPEATTFFLGIETFNVTDRPGMPRWQESLFTWMSRNTQRAMTSFEVPADRVVELGVQLDL